MSTDLIVEMPVHKLDWLISSPARRRKIVREVKEALFSMAVQLAHERGRQPSAFVGEPRVIPLEDSGVILDPEADAEEILVLQQRFTTSEWRRDQRQN